MTPRYPPTVWMVLAVGLFLLACELGADTLLLRNGKRYTNVRTRPGGDSHLVYFSNGGKTRVKNLDIRFLRISSVNWSGAAIITPEPRQKKRRIDRLNQDPDTPGVYGEEPLPFTPALEQPFWMSPIMRSALAPGWGQYYVGHKESGVMFISASALLLGLIYQSTTEHNALEAQYNDPLPPTLILLGATSLPNVPLEGLALSYVYLRTIESRVNQKRIESNNYQMALGLFWLVGLLDIWRHPDHGFFWDPPWARDVEHPINIYTRAGPGSFALGLEVHF